MQDARMIVPLMIVAALSCFIVSCGQQQMASKLGNGTTGVPATGDSKIPDASQVLAKWGIVELPGGEYLNIWLPNSKMKILIGRTQDKGDSVYLYADEDHPVFQFDSKGSYGAPEARYEAGFVYIDHKYKGAVWIDHNTDGRFDAKIEFGGEHHGHYIWFGETWVLTVADQTKGFKDTQGNVYRFDPVKGIWTKDGAGASPSSKATTQPS
jgi:hypothetical protein